MTTWQPYEDRDSPNRLDALVHAATNLLGRSGASEIATPTQLRLRDDPARLRRHLGAVRR